MVQDSRPHKGGSSSCATEAVLICTHKAYIKYSQGRVKSYHSLEHLQTLRYVLQSPGVSLSRCMPLHCMVVLGSDSPGYIWIQSAVQLMTVKRHSSTSPPIIMHETTAHCRVDFVCSAATGHQRSDGRGPRKSYLEVRRDKLSKQLPETSTEVLRNVRIYINGYLEDTTDIEMKRIVTIAGGQVMYVSFHPAPVSCCCNRLMRRLWRRHTASGATHILTSQQLSGAKTHKFLTTKSRGMTHVVRPEWVTESIKAGKRLSEREYAVIKAMNTCKITDTFGPESSSSRTASD